MFRNIQNSSSTSRSVLDPSWFGLRPFPCVKGSYLRLKLQRPVHPMTQAEHEKFRRQQAHTIQQQTIQELPRIVVYTSARTSADDAKQHPRTMWITAKTSCGNGKLESKTSRRTKVASRAVVTLWTKRGLSDGSRMSNCIIAPMRCAAMTSCANDRAAACRISLLTVRTYALSRGCNWAVMPGGTNASSMFGRASWLQSRKCRQQWTGHKSINMMNFLPCTLSDMNWQISCNVVTDIQRLSLWERRHQSGGGASGCTREVFPPKMSCADTSPVLETTSVNVMTLFWSEPRKLILSLASVIFAQPDCESMSTISAVLVQIENAFWQHSCLHSNQTIFLNNARSSRSSTSSGITHVVMCVLIH